MYDSFDNTYQVRREKSSCAFLKLGWPVNTPGFDFVKSDGTLVFQPYVNEVVS